MNEFFPRPDHDWCDAEFLIFCDLGISQSIYHQILCCDDDTNEDDKILLSQTDHDIASSNLISDKATTSDFRVSAYHVYNFSKKNDTRCYVQLSTLYRYKQNDEGVVKRKGAILFLSLTSLHLQHLLDRAQNTACLPVHEIKMYIDWHLTYTHVLSSFIDLKTEHRDLSEETRQSRDMKKFVSDKVESTNIARLLCQRFFFLESGWWLESKFCISDAKQIALTLKYYFFVSSLPFRLLQNVYVTDFDYVVNFQRDNDEQNFYRNSFLSGWYCNKVFLHFCKYIQFRQNQADTIIDRLYAEWRLSTLPYCWMGYDYVELLRKSMDSLWKDVSKEYRDSVLFSKHSTWCQQKYNHFVQKAKTRLQEIFRRYKFPDFFYEKYQLNVCTKYERFLAYKLNTYHPAPFLPGTRERDDYFRPLDIKTFNKNAGTAIRKHGNSVDFRGRHDVCVSAAEHMRFSNAHSKEKDNIPCPVFITHVSTDTEKSMSTWGISCSGNPKYYGVTEIHRRIVEEQITDRIIEDIVTKAKNQTDDSEASFLTQHLNAVLERTWSDLVKELSPQNLHETINPYLSIVSVPFDLDFKNFSQPLTLKEVISISDGFYKAMRTFVNIVCKAPSRDAPVPGLKLFTYKSKCPNKYINDETDRDESWCTCKTKIGLRLILRLPSNVLISDIHTLKACKKMICSLLKSDVALMKIFEEKFDGIYSILDFNVWNELKTLRLPFSSKEEDERRLCPIFTLDHDDISIESIFCKMQQLLLDPYVALVHRDPYSQYLPPEKKTFLLLDVSYEEEDEDEDIQRLVKKMSILIEGHSNSEADDGDNNDDEEGKKKTQHLKNELYAHFSSTNNQNIPPTEHISRCLERELYMQMKNSKFKNKSLFNFCKVKEKKSSATYTILTREGKEKFNICLSEDKKKSSNKVNYYLNVTKSGNDLNVYLHCQCFACFDNHSKCVLRWVLPQTL